MLFRSLAALALLIISVYLKSKGGAKWLFAAIPMVFMAVMTIWALVLNQGAFGTQNNLLLQVVNVIILIVAVWIVIEGLIKIFGSNRPTASAQEVT